MIAADQIAGKTKGLVSLVDEAYPAASKILRISVDSWKKWTRSRCLLGLYVVAIVHNGNNVLTISTT